MDPVTTAIVAGIAAGATKVGAQVIVDTYNALKKILQDKYGKKSEVVRTIKRLEEKPESKGRKQMVQEEIADVKADKDSDILNLAEELLEHLKSQPDGGLFIQQATGNYIAQAGPHATASVKVNQPEKD